MRRIAYGALVLLGTLVIGPATATAGPVYGFTQVDPKANAVNAATGVAQLRVEVIDLGGSQVAFKFTNAGPNASSITDIYFDDGTLLAIGSITNGPGVSLSKEASPKNLPGGNNIDFNATNDKFRDLTADSNSGYPGTMTNGVNPGEWVVINFTLQSGKTYTDTIAAINLSLANPGKDMTNGLRIGVHVQGFANGGSESFVNGPTVTPPVSSVPVPPTIILLGLGGLVGLGAGVRARWVKLATPA